MSENSSARRLLHYSDAALSRSVAQIFLRWPHGVLLIPLTHDVVAFKDGSGPVATDLHREAFRNASPHHVADSGTPQIVEEFADQAGIFAGSRPGFADIADRLAVSVEDMRSQLKTISRLDGSDSISSLNQLTDLRQFALAIAERWIHRSNLLFVASRIGISKAVVSARGHLPV